MISLIKKYVNEFDYKKLLILGDGNFSFSEELSKQLQNIKIYATSLDKIDVLHKDEQTVNNLNSLKSRNHVFLKHGVDATKIEESFPNEKFNLLLFNFPHVGGKSNIKKCRQLLEYFFLSAINVLHEGNSKVMVSLCKGQGGLPIDVSRGAYGNSWQISTQASKAGLIIRDVFPFNREMLTCYQEAGYRGSINKKFLSDGGLIHVLEKRKCFNTDLEIVDNTLCDFYRSDEFTLKYINSNLIREFGDIVNRSIELTLKRKFLSCKTSSCNEYIRLVKDKVILQKQSALSDIFSMNEHKNGGLVFDYFVQNDSYDILPYNHYISHRITYKLDSHTVLIDLVDEVYNWLTTSFFREYTVLKIECKCSSRRLECVCVDEKTRSFFPYINNNEFENDIDIESIPYFIDDITDDYTLKFPPEVTLHDRSKEEYTLVNPFEYDLDELEKDYFQTKVKTISNKRKFKFIIKGICVASITNEEKNLLTFYTNRIFYTSLGIKDVRYLFGEDKLLETALLEHLVVLKELNFIKYPSTRLPNTIKFPLCYRHDLCFWLKEGNTEEQLLSIVRMVTHDLVHSVRLIKVLRYEDSHKISYCYRIIYSCLHGALSHIDSVNMQNKLRKQLISIGYDLR